MANGVPNSRFSTDMFDPRLRRKAWIESMKPIYDISPIEKKDAEFKASSQVWEAGGLFFWTMAHDAQIMEHRRSKHGSAGENDYLFTLVYRTGGAKSIHDGRPTEHRPNDVHILDFSRDHRSVTMNSEAEGILAPYEMVGFEPDKHAANIRLSSDTPAGYILSELSAMVFEKLPTIELKEAEIMAGMLSGTLRSLISGEADDVAKAQAISGRRAVMQRFVVENIHDMSLDVATLCRKFDVSRATVFRDFEPGGLQHFITLHRLDRALNDIACGPVIRGRIALIADKWGFSSPAHFSRAFRDNFGFSPSDAVGVGREAAPIPALEMGVNSKWARWIKQ